jgi:hypothetical protein
MIHHHTLQGSHRQSDGEVEIPTFDQNYVPTTIVIAPKATTKAFAAPPGNNKRKANPSALPKIVSKKSPKNIPNYSVPQWNDDEECNPKMHSVFDHKQDYGKLSRKDIDEILDKMRTKHDVAPDYVSLFLTDLLEELKKSMESDSINKEL